MKAAKNGKIDCVIFLISADANETIQDNDGNTALMLANEECKQLLLKAATI